MRGSVVVADERIVVARAQRGDRDAFLELYQRHAAASWRLGLVVGRDPVVAEGAVINAFARVLGPADRRNLNRFSPVALQLLRATRTSAVDGSSMAPRTDPVTAGPRAKERTVVAFDQLPEQWRSVLWLCDAERLDLASVGAVLGLTEQSTGRLASRAIAGLREQFGQTQVRAAERPDCKRTANRLSRYVAGSLSDRDVIRVRRHLDRCEECRTRLDEVDDLAPRLRRSLPALPLAVQAGAVEAWRARMDEAAGPLGLRLPSGRPVPAWAERSLAGATAAVVSIGISAAVLSGGRGDGTDPFRPPVESALPIGSGDGESALGGELPGDEPTGGGDLGTSSPPATPAGDVPQSSGTAAAPTVAAPPASGTPRGAPSGSSPAPSPTTTIPPATPPTTAPDAPDGGVIDEVDEVVEPLDLCTGIGLLDDLVGCDSAEGTNPLGGLGL